MNIDQPPGERVCPYLAAYFFHVCLLPLGKVVLVKQRSGWVTVPLIPLTSPTLCIDSSTWYWSPSSIRLAPSLPPLLYCICSPSSSQTPSTSVLSLERFMLPTPHSYTHALSCSWILLLFQIKLWAPWQQGPLWVLLTVFPQHLAHASPSVVWFGFWESRNKPPDWNPHLRGDRQWTACILGVSATEKPISRGGGRGLGVGMDIILS